MVPSKGYSDLQRTKKIVTGLLATLCRRTHLKLQLPEIRRTQIAKNIVSLLWADIR